MVNRVDGVILGVGIVVLAASIVGVILYDEQSPQEYQLSWSESEAMELEERTDAGGPGEYTFDTQVDQRNLATAEFTVEVTASGASVEDSNVDVEVLTPEGETETCSFTLSGGQTTASDDCTAEFELNPRPEAATTSGTNRTDAEQQALEEADGTEGTGNWTTTVTIDAGTGLSTPDYDITLQPTVYTWEPTANQGGPGGRAG